MLALLLLLFSGQPDFIIVTNDNLQSKIITQELTVDWTSKEGPVNFNLIRLNEVREKIKSRVNLHIVNIDNLKDVENYRLKRLTHYPQYKLGLYSQDYSRFDERTFAASSVPLLTVYALTKRITLADDLRIYNQECAKRITEHYFQRTKELYNFAKQEAIEDISSFFCHDPECMDEVCCDNDTVALDLDGFIKKYQSRPNFPQEQKLVFPREPEGFFPWEVGYESDSEIGIQKTYYTSVYK